MMKGINVHSNEFTLNIVIFIESLKPPFSTYILKYQ